LVFWDVADAALFVDRTFQENLLLNFQGYPEDGSSRFLANICACVSTYTVSHPRGPIFSVVRASNITRNFLIYGL
jgi:hypothetical protein